MSNSILSLFSNETRLKLLLCLSESDKNVTQLIEKCGLSQSAVSQHLEKLRTSGLVSTKRNGKEIYYKLLYPQAAEISEKLISMVKEVKK